MGNNMKSLVLLVSLSCICCMSGVHGQTADSSGLQATIPQNLLECYRNSSLNTREYLPPMTINSLLAILRKLETITGVYMDMRTFSSQIMNSYRMDGIEKNPDVAATQYVTPYGPSGSEFYKYKILMDSLIPSSGSTFPDTALTSREKCALHFMLSLSVDRTERGDESTTCNSLTNYKRWDSRVPRDIRTYQEETEAMDPYQAEYRGPMLGQWMEGTGYSGLTCPMENGVIYSRYGAVKMGLVFAGVAAGLQSQSVSRRNLILVAKANSLRGRPFNMPRLYASDTNPNVSNIWAATLSGEIAEVSLLQGPLANNQMRVGLNGGWNDSVLPRYYFLQEDNKNAMTDTDIRGSIDGLIMGTNAQTWNNLAGGGGRMKLSQLIDMYFAERGVLNTNVRACQRVVQFNAMFTPDQIMQQSYAFSGVLESSLPPAVNVEDAGLQSFNALAVQKLISYVASMQDNPCSFASTSYTASYPSTGQVTKIVSPGVHVYIVLDFSYDYLDAARIASQLAERLEVSKFTGNISIINAKDASVVVNSTSNILDLSANFTRNIYSQSQRGFDLARIVRDVGTMLKYRLDYDRTLNTAGGPATVVLVVPYTTAAISDTDRDYINQRLWDLRTTVPDARFMFLSPGSKDKFTPFVLDTSKDVFTLITTDIPTSVDSVITRLKEVPRRIFNPTCMSTYRSGTTVTNLVHRAYIEPVGGIQYFRIHPNYFFQTTGGTIRITSTSGKTLNICRSRTNPLPGNTTQTSGTTGDTCNQITSDTYEIPLNYPCGDTQLRYCAPVYFSIAVVPSTSSSLSYCSDDNCRFPDSIQVDIRQDGLTCSSGALSIFSHFSVISTLVLVLIQLVPCLNS